MKVTIIVLFCIFFFCGVGLGEIYKWVDEKGTVHFTQDPSTIPEKYRTNVKSRTTEEDMMTPEEGLKEKKRHEEELKKRQAREQMQYEESLKEERIRKRAKEVEDAAYERSLKGDKEEKATKPPEVKDEEKIREQVPKQRLVKCTNCRGGYIKCRVCDGKGGRYVTRTTYVTCASCRGTGQEECTVCGGKGVILR